MSTHPEQAVLDAIAGLEQDEIGELVRWQLEEGRKRGDHLPLSEDPWSRRMDTSRSRCCWAGAVAHPERCPWHGTSP